MTEYGWCYACETTRDPDIVCTRGHRAILSRRSEVLCLDCACSNVGLVTEDGCPECKRAVAELTKLRAKKSGCAS